jgi:ABC-type Fe3+/spermidine/putrescine transport system ATPase subunit
VTTEFGETWKIGETVAPGQAVMLGIRPESLQLEPGASVTDAWNAVQGTVREVAYLGPTVRYSVTVADGVEMVAEIHNPDFSAIRRIGEPITLWFAGRQAILLSEPEQGDG